MAQARKMYLNAKQREFLAGEQKTKLFLGGRGSGKSHALGVNQRVKMGAMPRSKGILAATTYNQILTKTLPAIIGSWELFGLKEDIHYVIGRTPPKHFDRPLKPPKRYKYCISLINGRVIEMLSLDRPDLARGGSYDDADIDEAALLKREDWTRILLPSIRGNRHRFHHTHLHHQAAFYTSIPWKPSGYWIFDYEEWAKSNPEDYLVVEANAYDNIDILGEAGIERMRREMPHAEFLIEVMNERLVRVEGCFYGSLNRARHCYTPTYSYSDGASWRDSAALPNDYDPNKVLDTTWDFGGWFNCCGVWQSEGMTERWINSFHAGLDGKLSDVVSDINEAYADHQHRYIRIWGEPRGHDPQPNTPTIYEQIQAQFNKLGWTVEIMVLPGYATRKHIERREFVNNVLDENDGRLPQVRINEDQCKSPIIAMETTQTTAYGKKDKSKEKDRNYPQEHATHYTDGFDYYLMQKHGWRVMEDALAGQAGSADFI